MENVARKLASINIALDVSVANQCNRQFAVLHLNGLLKTAFLFYFADRLLDGLSLILAEELIAALQRLRHAFTGLLIYAYNRDKVAQEELTHMLEIIKSSLIKLITADSANVRIILGQLDLDIRNYIDFLPDSPKGFYNARLENIMGLFTDTITELNNSLSSLRDGSPPDHLDGLTLSQSIIEPLVVIRDQAKLLFTVIKQYGVNGTILDQLTELQIEQDAIITAIYLGEETDFHKLLRMYASCIAAVLRRQ